MSNCSVDQRARKRQSRFCKRLASLIAVCKSERRKKSNSEAGQSTSLSRCAARFRLREMQRTVQIGGHDVGLWLARLSICQEFRSGPISFAVLRRSLAIQRTERAGNGASGSERHGRLRRELTVECGGSCRDTSGAIRPNENGMLDA